MSQKASFFQSTIGRKQVVAVAGLALAGFVLSHMAGNLLLFVSPQAYNEYSHALVSNKLIYVAELGLLAFFVAHGFLAIGLQLRNWGSRPQRYAVVSNGEKGTSNISRTMAIQGVLIFIFVVLHLITFKFGPYYEADYGKGPIRDIFRVVAETFQSPGYVGWYVLMMVVLGLHLSHGVKSMLQTLGVHHPHYQSKIKALSYGYAILVAGGFILQPLYMLFIYKGN